MINEVGDKVKKKALGAIPSFGVDVPSIILKEIEVYGSYKWENGPNNGKSDERLKDDMTITILQTALIDVLADAGALSLSSAGVVCVSGAGVCAFVIYGVTNIAINTGLEFLTDAGKDAYLDNKYK